MKTFKNVVLFAALIALATVCFSAVAMAQNAQATPRYVTLPPHNTFNYNPPSNGATLAYFTINNPDIGSDRFIGNETNATTTSTVVIIPIKIVVGSDTFDPTAAINGGKSAIAQTIAGPLFTASQWTQGGTNLGNTQYEDAYTKGSLWQKAKNAANFHDLVTANPTIEPTVTITCSSPQCTTGINEFGGGQTIAYVALPLIDAAVQTAIAADGITANELPIAITYNEYMTSGGCCIGGYHSAYGGTGSQTYSVATYMTTNNTLVFSEDDGALSHEMGEWYEDPWINNFACGGYMEVGDPLETEPNYGLYNIPLGGYTYHLQDLVFYPYFFQTPSQAVNGWYTFQNESVSVCSRGQ
jgi:hypothetical protein